MPIPLKLIAANDPFVALVALADVLDGKQALFVTPPEVNGLMPEVHGLPPEVDDHYAAIVESSGSTGVPKRIGLTVENLLSSARATQVRLGGPGQWLLALPINYIAGLQVLVRSHLADTQPILMNTSVPFSAEGFGRASSLMTGERRFTSLVPTQLERLAEAVKQDDFLLGQLRSFDAVLVGGQAANPATVGRLRELGVKVVVTYGMTETSGGCVYDGVAIGDTSIAISVYPDPVIEIESVCTGVFGTMWTHIRYKQYLFCVKIFENIYKKSFFYCPVNDTFHPTSSFYIMNPPNRGFLPGLKQKSDKMYHTFREFVEAMKVPELLIDSVTNMIEDRWQIIKFEK